MFSKNWFRRFRRRAVKPLAMAGVAGALSLSLVITTPSNAQAFVPPVLPVIAGATTMAMPSVLATSLALHPVGWGILGLTALGVGLYASKDYWLPYLTGEMGEAGSNNEATPLATQQRHVVDTAVLEPDGVTVSVKYTNTTPFNQDWYAHFGVVAHCKKDGADGSFEQGYKYSGGNWSIGANDPTNWTYTRNFVPCPLGWDITGFVAGGGQGTQLGTWTPNLDTSDPNPAQMNALTSQYSYATKNVVKSGDMGAASGFDPRSDALSYRVEAECIASDGTIATATAESLGSEGGIKFPSCEAAGLGHGTGAVKVFTAAPGFAPDEVLWETKRPVEDPAQPLCSPTRPTSGCKLGVSLDGMPCVVGSVECENWSTLRNDPNHSTRLSCQYGPYTVSIETCNPLERAYEPGGAPATEPNTDGNPATRSDTMPNGQTQPKIEPGTGTAPGGFPSAGVNPSTGTSANCDAPEWSWNPVEFVRNPVFCTLQDAFIPKTDIGMRSDALADQAAQVVPISWLTNPIMGPSGGSCPNWTINVQGLSQNVVCNSSFTAALLGVRGPLFGLVAAAMVWPLIRGIWYASIPVLRVSPGSSK